MAPVVETDRLILRPFRVSDLEDQAAAMRDPDIVRYLGGTPHAREDTWRRMLAAPGLWDLLGYGYWAIERKADGAYLGQLGFADFKRDMTPSIEGLPEMGWLLVSSAHGQGYAGEGIDAALDWADGALKARQIVAIIDHANAPSIRVAERCGFTEREEAIYREAPILVFRRFS